MTEKPKRRVWVWLKVEGKGERNVDLVKKRRKGNVCVWVKEKEGRVSEKREKSDGERGEVRRIPTGYTDLSLSTCQLLSDIPAFCLKYVQKCNEVTDGMNICECECFGIL